MLNFNDHFYITKLYFQNLISSPSHVGIYSLSVCCSISQFFISWQYTLKKEDQYTVRNKVYSNSFIKLSFDIRSLYRYLYQLYSGWQRDNSNLYKNCFYSIIVIFLKNLDLFARRKKILESSFKSLNFNQYIRQGNI